MATAGKHIVVTGGCGFFGAWISAKLLAVDARVTIVDAVIANRFYARRGRGAQLCDYVCEIDFRLLS